MKKRKAVGWKRVAAYMYGKIRPSMLKPISACNAADVALLEACEHYRRALLHTTEVSDG